MGAKYNFTISGNSLLTQRTPISEDTQYKAISFKSPSLVQDNNKIKLFEAGEFQTSLRFIDFGLIDGVAPTDLQDAKDKLLALIGTINEGGGGNFIPLSGTTAGNPITGALQMADGTEIYSENSTKSTIFFEDGYLYIKFLNALSEESQFQLNDLALSISSLTTGFRGLSGAQDFSPNITDLDYTQKKYVDTKIALSGTTVGNPITGKLQTDSITALSSTQSDMYIGIANNSDLEDTSTHAQIQFSSNEHSKTTNLTNTSPTGVNVTLSIQSSDPVEGFESVVKVFSNDPLFRGFSGDVDFTPNITDLDYTQKIYVDAPSTQTQTQRSTSTSGTDNVNDTQRNIIYIHEAGATTTLSINLPATPVNNQIVTIMSVGGIVGLTIATAVGTIIGAVTNLSALGSVKFVWLASESKWYKI